MRVGFLAGLVALSVMVGCTHTVNIKSQPDGADISVNGSSVGKSPVSYTESAAGPGDVEIKATLNGKEVVKKVPRDEVNWPLLILPGVGTCLTLNMMGFGLNLVTGVFGIPLQCLGCTALVAMPAAQWFLASHTMKEQIVVEFPAGTAAAPPTTPAAPQGEPASNIAY